MAGCKSNMGSYAGRRSVDLADKWRDKAVDCSYFIFSLPLYS